MSYKGFLNYLNDLGLRQVTDYDYLDKNLNVTLETERFLNRTSQMFQWHGLPDTIPKEQLELMLQTQGYAIIGQIDGKIYACYGGLGGVVDEYFRPTQAIVSIPYLHFNATWNIGEDCIIIKNDLLKQGLLPLFTKYLTLQNETEITLLLSLVNKRVQKYISASDDLTIKSAEKYLEDLFKGKQGVISDNAFLDSLEISGNDSRTQELTDITDVLHYLRGQLYNEIGLATNYNLKKERITQAEVELNTDNLYPLIDNMLDCRREGIEECYNLFGVDWGVEFNSSWDYRIMNGEPIVTEGAENENTDTDTVTDILNTDSADDTIDSGDSSGTTELSNLQTESEIDNSVDVSDSDNSDSGDRDSDSSDSSEQLNELEQTVIEKIEENIIEVAETIAEDIVDTLTDDSSEDNENDNKENGENNDDKRE